ncbi:MAG: iron ABC transporter permease [Candidatus Sulfotelmatobacter sp.]
MAREIAQTRAAPAPQAQAEPQPRHRILAGILTVLLVAAIVVSLGLGAVDVPVRKLVLALLGRDSLSADQRIIILTIRLPRVLAAAIVGSALSVSGLLFQGLFRNPLADPYVIGSSGGALLGASVGVFLLSSVSVAGFGATALLAFLGAICSITLVYLLARVNGRTPVVALLLAGFAVSTMLSYSSYLLEVLDHDFGTGVRVLASWLHGTIAQPTWGQLAIIAAMLLFGLAGSAPLTRKLNTLALGEEYATHLGIHVQQTRIAVIVIGSVLTAAAVALGGLISFVGLIVPHMMRMLLGPDHTRLLPVTALAGAVFLLVADTVARTVVAPSELPVGVLTAFIGGPFFLYLLRKTKQETLL